MDEGHRIFKRFKESQRIPKATNGGGDNSLLMFICLNLIEKKTHVRLCSWKSNILHNVMIFRLYDLLFIIFSVLFFLFFSFFYATRFFHSTPISFFGSAFSAAIHRDSRGSWRFFSILFSSDWNGAAGMLPSTEWFRLKQYAKQLFILIEDVDEFLIWLSIGMIHYVGARLS